MINQAKLSGGSMNIKHISGCILSLLTCSLYADQGFYCPQNHGYINIGMSQEQVMGACGKPLSTQESNQPVLQRIPVQQLIYNNQGTSTAFYGVWNIPTGSGGTPMEVAVVNNVVQAIKVNGSDSNASSICSGNSFQIGDSVGKVYGACGSPDVVNNTFVTQQVPTAKKPEIWIYQTDPYQPPMSLTFVDGKLQSINN